MVNFAHLADVVESGKDGFTYHLPTGTEPATGIMVAYGATQGSHSAPGFLRCLAHALAYDGYLGGWYNAEEGLYYFDSCRRFEDLTEALLFAADNAQLAVYEIETSTVHYLPE